MFLTQITFARAKGIAADEEELEEAADWYLATLLKNGQVYGDRLTGWNRRTLTAYTYLARPDSMAERNHCEFSRAALQAVVELFGQSPTWKILEDNVPKRFPSWKRCTSFYLFTNAFEEASPLCCGDTGQPVPLYLLPISQETREYLCYWSSAYRNHDMLWIGSGALEIPAYKQMADPASELSQNGRDLCAEIQQATGIPTFYYIQRYWGRREGEENRLCPGCGSKWRVKGTRPQGAPFHQFAFRCKRCRLVSNLACADDDERHARIGEFKAK